MNKVHQKSAGRHLGAIGGALLKASAEIQSYARKVELRDPAVSKPFYAASAWLKTAAVIGGAL